MEFKSQLNKAILTPTEQAALGSSDATVKITALPDMVQSINEITAQAEVEMHQDGSTDDDSRAVLRYQQTASNLTVLLRMKQQIIDAKNDGELWPHFPPANMNY